MLKQKIIEKHILALLDFHKLFEVKCDASGMDVGVVLSKRKDPFLTSMRS